MAQNLPANYQLVAMIPTLENETHLFMLFIDCVFIRIILFQGRLQFVLKQHNSENETLVLLQLVNEKLTVSQNVVKIANLENETYE